MEKKNYKLSIITFLALGTTVFAQRVGINTENPQATLDIAGKAQDPQQVDGLLVPRITGNELKAKDTIYTTAQKGAIVYVTEGINGNTRTNKTMNVETSGYYYFNGSIWVKLDDTNIYTYDGNISSLRTVNITGTNKLFFKTNSSNNAGSKVVVGTTNSVNSDGAYEFVVAGDAIVSQELKTTKLVVGNTNDDSAKIKYSHPSKGDGKILTSDSDGNATWKTPEDRFYLPAVTLDTSSTGTKTVNLFDIYNTQYGTPIASSSTANNRIPLKKYNNATDLDYYVIYADQDVFDNISITENGVLSYNVKTTTISPKTFMNIVLVGKNK